MHDMNDQFCLAGDGALDHSARMLKGVPSPICWTHEWRGRPGRRRQPGPKRGPVLAAATCDNARWAGVWSSSLTTWPNMYSYVQFYHPYTLLLPYVKSVSFNIRENCLQSMLFLSLPIFSAVSKHLLLESVVVCPT